MEMPSLTRSSSYLQFVGFTNIVDVPQPSGQVVGHLLVTVAVGVVGHLGLGHGNVRDSRNRQSGVMQPPGSVQSLFINVVVAV